MDDSRLLRAAAGFYAVGFAAHTADHIRRGIGDLTTDGFWAGNLAAVLAIAAMVLVFTGARQAPVVAVPEGFGLALGYAVVHLAPPKPWLSDSLAAVNADALSWTAVALEIAGALALGSAGAVVLRRRRAVA